MKDTIIRGLLLLSLVLAAGAAFLLIKPHGGNMATSKKPCIIGIFAHWGTLTPPLQHSAAGDAVIAYQFEPLIRTGEQGVIEPAAAKSWNFSADRRVLRFKVDTSRRFSDGSFLCADDFKRSWENGLRMESKASNSSLDDGLGYIKGYSAFNKKGTIAGIRVISSEELELTFEKPFRLALEPLSGGRFAAYKIIDGRPIGTGPYVIAENDETLVLTPNTYYSGKAPGLSNVKIVVVPPAAALGKLKSGEVDAYLFAETASLPGCDRGEIKNLRCVYGQEGLHVLVQLNGMAGRFFSDQRHRRAFQALLLKNISLAENAFRSRGLISDSQSFLKFQAGRISNDEATAIIRAGEIYIPRLIEATNKRPIYIAGGTLGWQWLIDFLLESGLKLTSTSRADFTAKEFWEEYYKNYGPDVMPMGASVGDSDPDGLYHLLGRRGAIFSPIAERRSVCDGMESGRKILDLEQLPGHYASVSREILKEVPYVHLGYLCTRMAYNTNKLRISENLLGRRENPSIMLLEMK